MGNVPRKERGSDRGMCQEFGDRIFLVQGYPGRGTVDRGRPRSQVVDRTLPLAQLDRRLLHRNEGNTIVRQSKMLSHSKFHFDFVNLNYYYDSSC